MAVRLWADRERASAEFKAPEAQSTIGVFEALLGAGLDPKEAARKIVHIYEPIIRAGGNDSRIGEIWGILCSAVRTLGDSNELNDRLNTEFVSQNVFITSFNWLGPDSKMKVLEPDEDLGEEEWLSQATPFLNATSFAAKLLSQVPEMKDISFHAEVCLNEALEGPYETPSPQARASMYIAPAATWILLAGEKIYELCKENYKRIDGGVNRDGFLWTGTGFSLPRWKFWKQRLSEISQDTTLEETLRTQARNASTEMERFEV
ncbi:hypothetical protein IAQ61_002273 [Plenodomus lingam]|uniref:uncharacterized protein n=1 Tax=Leptosphaeria maculans TaxID=5022 RepID=UPI00331B8D63|nr:hypothetical protein IAQ61_002273 [Plenodomus lingam]